MKNYFSAMTNDSCSAAYRTAKSSSSLQKTHKSAVKDRLHQLAQTPDKYVENVNKLRQQEDSYHVFAKKALRGDKILQQYEQSSAKMKQPGMRHQLLVKETASLNAAASRSSLSNGKTRATRKTPAQPVQEDRLEICTRTATKDVRGRAKKSAHAAKTTPKRPVKNMVFSKNATLKSNDASPMNRSGLAGLNSRSSNFHQSSPRLANDVNKVSLFRPKHGNSSTPLKQGRIPTKKGNQLNNSALLINDNSQLMASSRQKSSTTGGTRRMLKSKESRTANSSHAVTGTSNTNESSSNEMRFSFNNASKKRFVDAVQTAVGAEVSQNYFHQQSTSQEPSNQKYEKIQKKSLIQQKTKNQPQMQPKILRSKVSEPAIIDSQQIIEKHCSHHQVLRTNETIELEKAESEVSRETYRKRLGNSYLDQLKNQRSKSKLKTTSGHQQASGEKSYANIAKQRAKSAEKQKTGLNRSFAEGCHHHNHDRQTVEPEITTKSPFALSHTTHNHHGQKCSQQTDKKYAEVHKEKDRSIDYIKKNKKQTPSSHYTSLHKSSIERPDSKLHHMSVRGSFNAGRSQERGLSSERYKFKSSQLIMRKFGAVLIGYKTRRIFNKNRQVIQFRTEFRDLIQFAYQLKQELAIFQDKLAKTSSKKDPRGHASILCQQEQTRKLLLQSLKDLISKRQQFQDLFNRLNKPGTAWMVHEAQLIQQHLMNSQKLSQAKPSVRSPRKTATATINLSSRRDDAFSPSSHNRLQQKAVVMQISPPKANKQKAKQGAESPQRGFSPLRNYIHSKQITSIKRGSVDDKDKHCEHHQDSKSAERKQCQQSTFNMLNQRIETDENKPRMTRESRKNQLTFGMQTKNISRADSALPHAQVKEQQPEVKQSMVPRIIQTSSVQRNTAAVNQLNMSHEQVDRDSTGNKFEGTQSSIAITPTHGRKVEMNSSFRPNLKKFIKDYQSPYRQAAKSIEGPLDGGSAYNGSTSAKNFVQANIERVTASKKDAEEMSQQDSSMPVFESKIPRLSVRDNSGNWKFNTFHLANKKCSVADHESKSPSRFGINMNNRRGTMPGLQPTNESSEALNINLDACQTFDMRNNEIFSEVQQHNHLGLPNQLANTQQVGDARSSNRNMRVSKRYDNESNQSSPLAMMIRSQQQVINSPQKSANKLMEDGPASPSMGDCMSPSQGLKSKRTDNQCSEQIASQSMKTIEALNMMDQYVLAKSPIKRMNFENQYLKVPPQKRITDKAPSYQLINSGVGMFDQQSNNQSSCRGDAYDVITRSEKVSPSKSMKSSPKKTASPEKENSLLNESDKLGRYTVDKVTVPRLNIPQSHHQMRANNRQIMMEKVLACGQSSQMSGSFRLNPCEIHHKSSIHSSYNQSMVKINEENHLDINENESPVLTDVNTRSNFISCSKDAVMPPKICKSKQPSAVEFEVMQKIEEDATRKRRRSRADRGEKVTKSQVRRSKLDKKSNSPKKRSMHVKEVQLDENGVGFSRANMEANMANFNSIMDISRDSVPLGGRDVLVESPSIVNTGSIEMPVQIPVKQHSPMRLNHYGSLHQQSSQVCKASPDKTKHQKIKLSPVRHHDRHCSSNVHNEVESPAKAPTRHLSVTPQRPSENVKRNQDASLTYQPAPITATPKPNRTLLASGGSRKRLTQGKRSKEAFQLQRMQSPHTSQSKLQTNVEVRSVYQEQKKEEPMIDIQERQRVVTTIAQLQEVLFKMEQSAGMDQNSEVRPEQVQKMIDNLQSQLVMMDQAAEMQLPRFDAEVKSSHSHFSPSKVRKNSRSAYNSQNTASGVDVKRIRI